MGYALHSGRGGGSDSEDEKHFFPTSRSPYITLFLAKVVLFENEPAAIRDARTVYGRRHARAAARPGSPPSRATSRSPPRCATRATRYLCRPTAASALSARAGGGGVSLLVSLSAHRGAHTSQRTTTHKQKENTKDIGLLPS